MTLEACYQELGGDYEGVSGRLLKEERVEKFMLKFLNDPSYENLCNTYQAGNFEEAFRAVHTLKGVGQNLGFTRLYEASDALTEVLRNGGIPADDHLFDEVTAAYQMTIAAIRKYQDEL